VKANRAAEDVLVFMPGGYEIQRTIEAIRSRPESRGYVLLPLHGELPLRDQDAAVARQDRPKVVVATNVAETSITIDGIRLVIDSGLARIPRYDPNRGINTLLVEHISQSSAEQRTGRAGRTAPGQCIRLWSMAEHEERPAQETPEVRRLDLSEVVLTLKASGVDDLRKFRWLEPPSEPALRHAEDLLTDLGALDPAITEQGRRMLAFPLHPRYSRMLLAAQDYGCVPQACLIAALTQGRDLLTRKERQGKAETKERKTSDFDVLARAWEYAVNNRFDLETMRTAGIHVLTARQVGLLYRQFLKIAHEEGLETAGDPIEGMSDEGVHKCVLIGFSDRVARRIDDSTSRCELVHGRRGVLAHESVVRQSPLLVVAEIQEISGRPGELNTILSMATAIDLDWLHELFPEDMKSELRSTFDSGIRRVIADEAVLFRDLVVSSRKVDPPADAAARLLADEVYSGRLQLPNWDHGVEQWILRLKLLADWCPDLHLPPIEADDRRQILEQLCFGAFACKDLKDRDVKTAVRAWLSYAQRDLVDKYAPERITLSNGRTPKVVYEPGLPPYISLRIQELFGVTDTPKIAMGRIPLSVHILAPSMRPVQVTHDLANFWREHYPRIKAELQRRYPKHEWR
jgi:ATP-dependent helicase HrpB